MPEGMVSVPDLVLVTLYHGPVHGMVRFQSEVFLVWNEILERELASDPVFRPSRVGPYSELVKNAVTSAIGTQFVRVVPRGDGHQTFYLTGKGQRHIDYEPTMVNFTDAHKTKLQEKKVDWDEWTARGIKRYIFRNYPRYVSKVKHTDEFDERIEADFPNLSEMIEYYEEKYGSD